MKTYLSILVLLFLLAACAQPPYLYYGNSSHGYYKAVKKHDDKSVAQYKQSLEDVFAKSAKLGKPVPPGLYCDYALLLVNENKTVEAKQYFVKEMETWSESTTFIKFIMQRYNIGN